MSTGGGRASAEAVRRRRRLIAEKVAKRGTMSVEDVASETGVSTMTAYRDIEALVEEGLVTRQGRGTVSAAASRLSEVSALLRLEQNSAEKVAIARAAAALIRPGSSVLIDDSTSALWALRELASVPLTVVTNSLLVAREVEPRSAVRLLVTGGEYQPWAESLLGKTALDMISGIRTDYCLLSASGISDGRCFHPYEDVALVKRAMVASAEKAILLLDHTKFARRALHSFAPLTDFSHIVTDSAIDPADLELVRQLGPEVVVAE
ncbi:DeoR/GlpR family DNA-binding transcription regulator [Tessaracoccus lacteus]|uniref:DeoR/GlpR family DNA-binding transcription regulator n=1 Tax=Tessaracoccus lacteus TaxID=3041766 RepID=A0ABY8PZB4_9ACTN|nr:DeoR/GlpR family DNA-binding transcription regulator [Tessaracoccus sp. T21]WGT47596.1 DeoR/GlpR family DNA-binding transcription regulator [Tessaracoccus sp. T21]